MSVSIKEIVIHNYRSISKMKVKMNKNNFYAICGANNVGKTNFLRALDLFFSIDAEKFDPLIDIPFHIVYGSRGSGYKSEIQVSFEDDNYTYVIKKTYSENKDYGKMVKVDGTKKQKGKNKKENFKMTDIEVKEFLDDNFCLFYVEASNVDLPQLISQIIKDEVLPIGLKRKNSTQDQSMDLLKAFIASTHKALSKIEQEITNNMKSFVTNIEGIDTSLWNMRILFPEYNDLREAISGMINFTLYDTNSNSLETKGSGMQRIVLLSLIRYVSEKMNKKIIWCIDEPEAFLQPSLQKQTKEELISLIKSNYMFITTHSHFFVDLSKMDNTLLFTVSSELKEYKRSQGKKYYKKNTEIINKTGYAKAEAIKKHLGLEINDSWEIMPYNIIVEGDDDKKYILELAKKFGIEMPNIISSGGVSKIQGVLGYINLFCEHLQYKPKVLCLIDHDEAGRSEYNVLTNNIKRKVYDKFAVSVKYIIRSDNVKEKSWNYEIEDFIYPQLFFKIINRILKEKGYKTFLKKHITMRSDMAYKKMHILEYATQMCKILNSDKAPLDFNNIGMKKYICLRICNELSTCDISKYDEMYPEVKKFLSCISNEFGEDDNNN